MRGMGGSVFWRHGADDQKAPVGVFQEGAVKTREALGIYLFCELECHVVFYLRTKLPQSSRKVVPLAASVTGP